MGVLFNSLNRKILAIFIRGYYDKSQRRLNYETFKEKRTSNHLKTSSELVYNCVGYISLNPDYISFERVFMPYKKYRLYLNKFRYEQLSHEYFD